MVRQIGDRVLERRNLYTEIIGIEPGFRIAAKQQEARVAAAAPVSNEQELAVTGVRNPQYWHDLVFEGQQLTKAAEGVARDLSEDIADIEEGRAWTRRDAERFREWVKDTRRRDPNRREHRLQDVIDAYRWNYREAVSEVPLGVGYSRPGR